MKIKRSKLRMLIREEFGRMIEQRPISTHDFDEILPRPPEHDTLEDRTVDDEYGVDYDYDYDYDYDRHELDDEKLRWDYLDTTDQGTPTDFVDDQCRADDELIEDESESPVGAEPYSDLDVSEIVKRTMLALDDE